MHIFYPGSYDPPEQTREPLTREEHAERVAQRVATHRMDTGLAKELGLQPPYARPDLVGHCPGSTSLGHGLTARSVHGGCCERWEEAREAALSSGLDQVTDADRRDAAERVASRPEYRDANGREPEAGG